jgi:hypothetical protein
MKELPLVSISSYIQQFNLMYFKSKKDSSKIIITSAKCGTRYLSNVCELNSELIRIHPAEFTKGASDYYFENISEIYWIVRPPMEHLISAIMTEHSSNMNLTENPNKVSSKLKIKKNDEDWKIEVLEKLLKDILTEPKFTINNSNDVGNNTFSHYQSKYEILYNDIQDRIELFSKIKFVELKNLSELMESEFKLYTNIENQNYTFNTFFTKDSILETMQLNFADMWSELKAIVDNEQYYYDNLLKYDYDKLFVKKINESYKELDDVYKKLEKLIPSYSIYKLKNIKNNINTIKKQLSI